MYGVKLFRDVSLLVHVADNPKLPNSSFSLSEKRVALSFFLILKKTEGVGIFSFFLLEFSLFFAAVVFGLGRRVA